MDRVPISVDRYANTSGTSLPLTLIDAYAGHKKEKLRLLTCAFGIGLHWELARKLELEPSVIEPIFLYDGRCDEMLASRENIGMACEHEGRHYLVIGASSGIGESIALELASLGANITMLARRVERMKEIQQKMKPGRSRLLWI